MRTSWYHNHCHIRLQQGCRNVSGIVFFLITLIFQKDTILYISVSVISNIRWAMSILMPYCYTLIYMLFLYSWIFWVGKILGCSYGHVKKKFDKTLLMYAYASYHDCVIAALVLWTMCRYNGISCHSSGHDIPAGKSKQTQDRPVLLFNYMELNNFPFYCLGSDRTDRSLPYMKQTLYYYMCY